MAYKYPICDVFHWFCKIARFFATEPPEETCDNLLMGLRLGQNPLCMITSTPRPTKFLMELEKRTDKQGRPCTVTTKGRTQDNFRNLSPVFISTIISKYQGTRLGRQELEGDFLDDNPDALWKRADIDNNRVRNIPELVYVVVGVDPAVTSKEGSDDTGIIVAGKGTDGHGYVLGDYTIHDTPKKWAEAVITAYNRHEAKIIVGETNNGGDLVELNIKAVDTSIPFKAVHTSRGKATRAEPISALYEQNSVHHFGTFPQLEDQMCEWIPGSGKSPDRIDSLVWSLTSLDLNSYAEWDNSLGEGSSFASYLDDGGEDTWSQMGFSDNKNAYAKMGF